MPTFRDSQTLGIGATVANLLAGSQFEFIAVPSQIQIYMCQDATGIGVAEAEIFFGQELQQAAAPIPVVADGTGPIVPDTIVVDDVAAPGDRLVVRVTETGGAVPEVAGLIQPVQLVGDATLLTAPLLPPSASFGGTTGTFAGQFSAVHVIGSGPGGCAVRHANFQIAALATVAWRVQPLPAPAISASIAPARNFGPKNVQTRVEHGFGAATLGVDDCQFFVFTAGNIFMDDVWFVPPGFVLVFEVETANNALIFSLIIQDLAAIADAGSIGG